MNIIFFFKKSFSCVLLVSASFIALSAHAVDSANTHFIPGFITTQPLATSVTVKNIVTKVTGKMSGQVPSNSIDFTTNFTAIKLGNGLFLAQHDELLPNSDNGPLGWLFQSHRKTGVFFEITGDGKIRIIKVAESICTGSDCQGNILFSEVAVPLMTSKNSLGHGISDITISTTLAKSAEYFVPGFITTKAQPTTMNASDVLVLITGKLGGSAFNPPVNFTAIPLGKNSFLAQTVTDTYKKGVFFKIAQGHIRATEARYCLLLNCRGRNVALTDSQGEIAKSQESSGYGIFDLTLFARPTFVVADFVNFVYTSTLPGFVTTTPATIETVAIAKKTVINHITGKFAGGWVKTPVDFTTIELGNHSFLAQIVTSKYKKGVFFEIKNGKIKATQARYCNLSDCRNRNVQLSDIAVNIATSKTGAGYGIFAIKVTASPNLALHKSTVQSSQYQHATASKAVDGNTDGTYQHGSVTSTRVQQDAWWKVDLGDIKFIQQIKIFNRTDACCKNRLNNYRVSVSNDVNFKTTTYQKMFHYYPDPETAIDFDIQNVSGRYIKVQLLGDEPLSLAEVQVFGFNALRIPYIIDSDDNK